MTHSEKAKELFLSGYNCSQAVLGAYCEELGLDMETAMKLSSSFGGGMGRMREVCGAVSGMFMVEGLRKGYSDPKASTEKAEHYKRIQELAAEFIKDNGSIICRQLLGLEEKKSSVQPEMLGYVPEERTSEYYKKRPCADLVAFAAGLLEKE